MPRKIATVVANRLQALYEQNRVPETWGSPSVSRETFDQLRTHGFVTTARYLFQRLREVGQPNLSPACKFFALISGVGLVALVNAFLHTFTQECRPAVKDYGKRRFSAHTPAFAVVLYAIGAALLVAANGSDDMGGGGGGGSDDHSFFGESSPDERGTGWDGTTHYRAYGRRDEGDGGAGDPDQDNYDNLDTDDDDPSRWS